MQTMLTSRTSHCSIFTGRMLFLMPNQQCQSTKGNNNTHTHEDTHTFNGPLSGTTRVSRYQKGKTNLDFTEASDSEWQWHQLGYMQVCTSLQTDNHSSTPPPKATTWSLKWPISWRELTGVLGQLRLLALSCSSCAEVAGDGATRLLLDIIGGWNIPSSNTNRVPAWLSRLHNAANL